MSYYTQYERYETGNSKLYDQLDLIDCLIERGRDDNIHSWRWAGNLEKHQNNIELSQSLIDNLEKPSEEFLTILLSMLKLHVEECLKDFKKDVVKQVIE
jgi:hypothetical protein